MRAKDKKRTSLMYEKIKGNSLGITLIALVITIIVLLVLAGVTISTLSGENGILTQATNAKNKHNEAQMVEALQLKIIEQEDLQEAVPTVIWNSPYQYQLLGSPEQEKIEKVLGRKLEATDLFYEVNMDELGYSVDQKKEVYLYHKKEGKIVTVNPQNLKRNQGAWYWTKTSVPEIYQYFENSDKRKEMLAFLKNEGITEVYVSFGKERFSSEQVGQIKDFVRDAYENGIVVEYLTGDATDVMPKEQERATKEKIDTLVNYNQSCAYNEKLRGIHYDVEIHTSQKLEGLSDWKSSNSETELASTRKINYITFTEKAHEYAKQKGITVSFDFSPLSYAANQVNYQGKTMSLAEAVVKNSDYVSAMAYKNDVVKLFRYICLPSDTEYDKSTGRLSYTSNTKSFSDGTLRGTDTIYALAQKYRKTILVGVEIGETGDSDDFYDLGKSEMKNRLQQFANLMSKSDEDIVVGSRSLKQQSAEKCNYLAEDFDHFGFSYHYHYQYFVMPD